jgi:hypothetical protein
MHGPINVKSTNNISKWQIRFISAFKGLTRVVNLSPLCTSVNNTSFEAFGIYQLDNCLCAIREVAEKLAQELGSETLAGRHSHEGVEGDSVTNIKRCNC